MAERTVHNIYVPPKLWARWVKAAKKAGISVSAYLRLAVEKMETP